jgi:hypothetical protein
MSGGLNLLAGKIDVGGRAITTGARSRPQLSLLKGDAQTPARQAKSMTHATSYAKLEYGVDLLKRESPLAANSSAIDDAAFGQLFRLSNLGPAERSGARRYHDCAGTQNVLADLLNKLNFSSRARPGRRRCFCGCSAAITWLNEKFDGVR